MTGIQQALDFEIAPPPSILTLNGMVYRILKESGDWWAPWELCNAILNRHGVKISDSSVTARLRDLRKPRYGAHIIEKRRRENSTAYEYRLAA
jgi:hypothetical protein